MKVATSLQPDAQEARNSLTAKHTPGPWHLTENGSIEAKSERWGQSTGVVLIAKMYKHWFGSADRVSPDEIQDANARLIAAAPDLLEACRDMVEAFTAGTSEQHIRRLAAIAAIAKAGPALEKGQE